MFVKKEMEMRLICTISKYGFLASALLLMSIAGQASFAQNAFDSDFPVLERVWIGPEYWANPMEDWYIKDGRLECYSTGANRNVHLLTRQLKKGEGTFSLQVHAGLIEKGKQEGSVGFRFAIQDQIDDYRSRLFHGYGIDAGITTDGKLYIGDKIKKLDEKPPLKSLVLALNGKPAGNQYELTLTVKDRSTGNAIGSMTSRNFASQRIAGNIAIVNNYWVNEKTYNNVYRSPRSNGPRFWFDNWQVSGTKIAVNEEQTFGPILWSMYSLSRGVMKMTAVMPPLGEKDTQTVALQVKKGGEWKTIGKEQIHTDAYTATFRIPNWDDAKTIPYRLAYALQCAEGTKDCYYSGVVRKDPKAKNDLVLAAFCCQTDFGFPHLELMENVKTHDPDLLFFSGDQIYESVGGYGIIRTPADRSILNFLRKQYMFGWAFRDVMKNRPTLCLPDDHDVFQGNIWGNGGNATSMKDHDGGGYAQPAEMVNVVHNINCAHHPDFYDPTPIKQDISVYYGDMVYGRVSFAIIADRMFKSGPKFTVTTWAGRPDHIKDPNIDIDALDKPGLTLLGDRQLEFLDVWGTDWRGADMKCVLSQTIFCNVATHHGGGLKMRLIADLDSNGWPQTGRNKAVDAMRKAFAVHVAGDQHLPSLLRHGIDDYSDACWSFCVPAISVGYQRAWWPDKLGIPVLNRPPHDCANTGDYMDGLNNLISVWGIGNPVEELCKETRICTLHDKSSGYGIARFHKDTREITMEAWKLDVDVENPSPDDQFCGWPKTISMQENYGRKAKAWLPTLQVSGMSDPVVQIIDEENNETVYTLRIQGNAFTPKVFHAGTYTIKVGNQEDQNIKTLTGVNSLQTKGSKTVKVDF
ncbi:twin-arginine translocation pathway signal [bacterium]|nr:twin-arginine translocation pathway signal [bacterium]